MAWLEDIIGNCKQKKLFKVPQGFPKSLTQRMPLALLKECRLDLLIRADTLSKFGRCLKNLEQHASDSFT